MPNRQLPSARLKVNWAYTNIQELNAAIRDYSIPDKHSVTFDFDTEAGANKAILKSPPLPIGFPLAFGDIVHQLRSALDCAIYDLLVPKIGKEDRGSTYFLFHETRANLEDRLEKGLIGRLDKRFTDTILEKIKPYRIDEKTDEKGDAAFWAMNKLDQIDKHRTLLVTEGLSGIHFHRIRYTNPAIVDQMNTFIARVGQDGTIFDLLPYEIIDANYDIVVFVRIGDKYFTGEPLIPTLQALWQKTVNAIVELENVWNEVEP